MTSAADRSLHNIHTQSEGSRTDCQVVGGVARRGRPSIPLVDRFWSKVKKTPTCWLWTSTVHKNGYGQIALSRNGRARQQHVWAHRTAWELTRGVIGAGLSVLHRCDTPTCVNPDHLFLGTQRDNIDDAIAKGRMTGRPKKGSR